MSASGFAENRLQRVGHPMPADRFAKELDRLWNQPPLEKWLDEQNAPRRSDGDNAKLQTPKRPTRYDVWRLTSDVLEASLRTAVPDCHITLFAVWTHLLHSEDDEIEQPVDRLGGRVPAVHSLHSWGPSTTRSRRHRYACRNAVIGSERAARPAGRRHAAMVTVSSKAVTSA